MVYQVPLLHYLHVRDNNTSITTLVVGATTFVRQDNQTVIVPPTPMITVPPRHYCIVKNPVDVDGDGRDDLVLAAADPVSRLQMVTRSGPGRITRVITEQCQQGQGEHSAPQQQADFECKTHP